MTGRGTPSTLLAALLVLGALPACVSRGRLVEAEAALRHGQTEQAEIARALAAAEAATASARAESAAVARLLRERDAELEGLGRSLSGAELQVDVAARERGEQSLLVAQLLSELGRAGDHLQGFARERGELAAALDAATARLDALDAVAASAQLRALLVRDLTLSLHAPLATGEIELVLVDGDPVLRVPTALLFDDPDGSLRPAAAPILGAVARVVTASEASGVVLAVSGTLGDRSEVELLGRLERLAAALGEQGIAAELLTVTAPSVQASRDLSTVLGAVTGPEIVELRVRT